MPAVVRMKRYINEEPLSAFVLNSKRPRLNDGVSGECHAEAVGLSYGLTDNRSAVLRFAGTINSQDDAAISQFASDRKNAAKELIQLKRRKTAGIVNRTRKEVRDSADKNRFQIVNWTRKTLDITRDKETSELTIVDVEKQANNTSSAIVDQTCLKPLKCANTDTGYVYDIYLQNDGQEIYYGDKFDINQLSIQAYDDIFCGEYYDDQDDDNESEDSEDSNQENYYGNDYPDEEDGKCNESEEDDSLKGAIEKFMIDDEDDEVTGTDRSSDDEEDNEFEDPYVHSIVVEKDEEDFYSTENINYQQRFPKHTHANKREDDSESDN